MVLEVNRLLVVVAEIGQVQRKLVVDVPHPGLQTTSSSSTSRFKAFDFVSGFWFIRDSFDVWKLSYSHFLGVLQGRYRDGGRPG
jgi:hypothetical protein